jgi:integrase
MAMIRQKGRRWQVVWNTYEEGRRVQRCRTFATNAAAKQHRAKMVLLEQRGVGVVRTTLIEYLTGWVETKSRTVEANTLAGYERWISHIRRCPVAVVPLERITPRELEQAYRYLLDRPAGRGKPLSAVSVRHVHAVLQNALGDAVRHRLIDSNPAASAKPPRGQSPKVGVPSAEQVGALLDDLAVHNPDIVDLALVIIGTGLRRSEALGLRWRDIDWSGRISIKQVVIEFDGRWSIREGTKSIAGQRTIGIAPSVIAALRRQQVRVAELRLKIGRFWRDHDLVFPGIDGGPRAPVAITKAFTRAAKRARWPEHSSPVHSLRHAAASHALAAGIDLAVISRRLGHSSAAVTARIYLSGDAERDSEAATVMANIPRKSIS